jgi:anti-sigma B factor antagonist
MGPKVLQRCTSQQVPRARRDDGTRSLPGRRAAAVLMDIYPVQWTGRRAVIALPEHIDVSNAGQIREELLSVINRGPGALIADLSATISCDHAGADAVVRAYQRALASGTELRLVVTTQIVRRVLSFSGLDRLVSIYPSLQAATAARAPATVIPVAAARPQGPGAAISPAVSWKLIDALRDGVALADGRGALVLANLRLEEMFGYAHAELIGCPVESLREAARPYTASSPGRHTRRRPPAGHERPPLGQSTCSDAARIPAGMSPTAERPARHRSPCPGRPPEQMTH